ncbi:hypothetical protein ED236_00930 [Pseudomethylobacillus aquaticus]|uniref:Mechanosensitive ion channel family protein n=1 Tax=Pseudomethylobacillus aquaticus TaxID=2676064 RepID=A0A3N0V6S9_9PROT|nr:MULTISPECIES: hypothetical protein [Methylophilaceae]ROH88078.1 hypothetical protein ED236_00930 [Pseudomethylobacillus aquaticus]
MQYQIDVFLSSLNLFWQEVVMFFPKFLAVILIVLFGWICAKIACLITKRVLVLTRFDQFAERSGLEAFLRHGGFDLTLSDIISLVIYWLVILLFVTTGANTLGLNEIASMLNNLANYLPKIILAIIVLIFGTLFARFINRLIFAWLHGIKIEGALAISTSAEYGVQIFAIFVALEQLDIGTHLLTAMFIIAFGAVFLALAIAFGLGGKEWAAKQIDTLQDRIKK